MPVAQSRGHAGKALLVAGVSVVLLLGLAFLVAVSASKGNVNVRLGDDRFDAGDVDSIAKRIDHDDGLPILYPDLVSRERNLFVQHRSSTADKGWVAFGAFDPDDPSCPIQIDRDRKILVNGCDESHTYPIDGSGTGLRRYPTTVEDGHLIVDLNELSTSTTSGG
jgi:hypothetical protein